VAKAFDKPTLWIFCGPNGCGKSTVYSDAFLHDFDGSIWIINPDLLTAEIRDHDKLPQQDANLETVLSTGKYRALVEAARSEGFAVRLVYVIVRDAALQLERIQFRVAKGGHDVPADKIIARRQRSLAQLPWFLDHADLADIFDNSGAAPKRIGRKLADGTLVIDPASPRDLIAALSGEAD
jgi:predicted ABC-type ATPase